MFGFRGDGIKLKNVDPIIRLTSYIMPQRNDALVTMEKAVKCEPMDQFIKEKAEEGIKLTYMHIVIAGLVRMYALRPKLNRFVMSGRIYARRKIYIAFTVKKRLTDDADETTVKLAFTGHETLMQIKEKIDAEVSKVQGVEKVGGSDKLASAFLKLPHFILKPTIGFVKWLDTIGAMPKSILEVSPFHTSGFLTNMKSLSSEHVLHHIYNFGTTGQFIAMGKEKIEPVVNEQDKIDKGKIMKLGLVIDERICDGLYYTKAVKIGVNAMQNPKSLEEGLQIVPLDPDL